MDVIGIKMLMSIYDYLILPVLSGSVSVTLILSQMFFLCFFQKRFLEQRAAIIAAFLDERLKSQKDARLLHADLSDAAIKSVEDYVEVMAHLYQATLMISTEQHPSCGLVLPLLVS